MDLPSLHMNSVDYLLCSFLAFAVLSFRFATLFCLFLTRACMQLENLTQSEVASRLMLNCCTSDLQLLPMPSNRITILDVRATALCVCACVFLCVALSVWFEAARRGSE